MNLYESPTAARSGLSLPTQNSAQFGEGVLIKKGTFVRMGAASAQLGGVGGGTQIEIVGKLNSLIARGAVVYGRGAALANPLWFFRANWLIRGGRGNSSGL